MAGHIKLSVEKLPTQGINTQINSRIFEEFQKKCKRKNLQMCTVLEVFMAQYANGNYHIDTERIDKWNGDNGNTSTLNTPVNKEVYINFKAAVKGNKLFVKSVLSVFIEDFGNQDLIMEFVRK